MFSCYVIVSLRGADVWIIVLWLLWTGRCVPVNVCKLMASITVLRKTRSAECVLVRSCSFVFNFHYCCTCFPLCLVMVYQYNCYYCVKLYCVPVELIIPHKTWLFEIRRFKGLRAESCGPPDRHLLTLPLWLATWGFTAVNTSKHQTFEEKCQQIIKNFTFLFVTFYLLST